MSRCSYLFFHTLLFGLSLTWTAGVHGAKPFCGDGKCTGGETVLTCPLDCSAGSLCGDNVCDGDETCVTCEADCGACPPPVCNNDGICNLEEDCYSCPGDCAGNTGGKPNTRFCCGVDTCDAGLCGDNCGLPMVQICGNGIIESGEECDDGNTQTGDGCDANCLIEQSQQSVPANQFNVGDSIGEGEAADGTIGEPHHETVWSTGYQSGDIVSALNERFEAADPEHYYENDTNRDPIFNHALSGAVMADFITQAQDVVSATAMTPEGSAGMISVFLGNNDVCAADLASMTDPGLFAAQFRSGLDTLAADPATRHARIQVSSIPAIYWLWNAKQNDFWCRVFVWPFVPCENLLDNPADDCVSDVSRTDPDNIYPGDGVNCQRRKEFHRRIREEYNPIIQAVVEEYRSNGTLPNSAYVDIFDVQFGSEHVNDGDCFHPSNSGHALLAEKAWCRSQWGSDDPLCTD